MKVHAPSSSGHSRAAASVQETGSAFSAPLQREVANSWHKNDEDKNPTVDYENKLDKAVQKAYGYVVKKPGLGALADIDGHTEHWVKSWNSYCNNDPPSLMAAAFGYAVESVTGVSLPPAPEGMGVATQGARAGTRPDVVLSRKGTDVAWLDITASNSKDHIKKKVGWDKIAHVSEVTYPSTDESLFQDMLNKKDEKEEKEEKDYSKWDFDEDALKKQVEKARKLHETRREHWQNKRRDEFLLAYEKPNVGRETANLNPEKYKDPEALKALEKVFEDAPTDKRTISSVLYAMNVSRKTYGYDYSCDISTGESWLLQFDKKLPQPEVEMTANKKQDSGDKINTVVKATTGLGLGAASYYVASVFAGAAITPYLAGALGAYMGYQYVGDKITGLFGGKKKSE